MPTERAEGDVVACPCCHGRGSSWTEKRGYECVMCHGANVVTEDRLPEWDHIVGSAG